MTAVTADRTDLLERIDLAELFAELGMVQGRNRQWTCPNRDHAQSGNTPPASIGGPAGDHVWCCHGCGAGGTAIDLLRHVRGVDTAEAFAFLRERVGSPSYRPPAPRPRTTPRPKRDPDEDRLEGDEGDDVLGRYLEARRWSTSAADAFGLYAVRGRWGHPRVRHPYRVDGVVTWWQDRLVYDNDRGPKWSNPVGLARLPYALDLSTTLTWTTDGGRVFVVEGPADVIALWHAAPWSAVIGIPGTEGVRRWAPLLAGLDVFILTDPDEAGDRAAAELAPLIYANGGRSIRLRPPLDVDDWRREIGEEALADAVVELAEAAGDWWTPTPTVVDR